MSKIKSLIRVGSTGDVLDAIRLVVNSLGKSSPALAVVPYGMESNPPEETLAVIMQQEGNEGALLTIVTDVDGRQELESGEVAFGSPESETRWKARSDGTVTIVIQGNDGGDFLARFNELKSGFDELKSDFNAFLTHVHSGVTTGTGVSGVPTPPATPSTASIDDAKIDEIEVPS